MTPQTFMLFSAVAKRVPWASATRRPRCTHRCLTFKLLWHCFDSVLHIPTRPWWGRGILPDVCFTHSNLDRGVPGWSWSTNDLAFIVCQKVVLFLAAAWGTGTIFGKVKFPPLLGWIIIGVCLGPQLADIIPYASDGTCNRYRSNGSYVHPDLHTCLYGNLSKLSEKEIDKLHCPPSVNASNHTHRRLAASSGGATAEQLSPEELMAKANQTYKDNWQEWCMHLRWQDHDLHSNIWQFIGNVGVGLMIFESGMHIHFDKVRLVGCKAFFVAIFGTALPLVMGLVLVGVMFEDAWFPDGLSAGVALAPTSVAIAIKVLDESKKLNTIPGQTILLAAFVDDIFSLVMLGIMMKLTEGTGQISAGGIVVPIVLSFTFIGVAALLAIYVFPYLRPALDKIGEHKTASLQPRDMLHLVVMFLVFFFASWLASLIGSFLLGAFSAGMCFVNVARSQLIWRGQVKRVASMAMLVFFTSSVGFSVPLSKMLDGEAFGKGLIIAIVPTILAKILSGFFFCEETPLCCSSSGDDDDDHDSKRRSTGHGGVVIRPSSSSGADEGERAHSPFSPRARKKPNGAIAKVGSFTKNKKSQPTRRYDRSYSAPSMSDLKRKQSKEMGDDIDKKKSIWRRLRPSWAQLMVGFAMVGRGEFAYLVAETMNREMLPAPDGQIPRKMMKDEVYSVVMWALILSTITAPFGFRWAVKMYAASKPMERAAVIGGDMAEHSSQKFYVKLIGQHHVGLLHELVGILNTCGLDVLEAKAETDNEIDYDTFLVEARGSNKDFDDEKLEEIQHAIQEVVNDKDSQVIFERCELDTDFAHDGVLEIRVVGDHHPDILHEITDMLDELGLDVFKAATEAHEVSEHGQMHREEEDVFYARSPDDGTDSNKAIHPSTRAKVRMEIMNIIKLHEMHGEVMVKVIHQDEAAIHHHMPNFDLTLTDMIATIRCYGPHHKEQLHEICDFLAERKLDVLHAEVDHHGNKDENVFCVAHQDQMTPIDMAARKLIRLGVLEIFRGHGTEEQCVVSVRQYNLDKAMSDGNMSRSASREDLVAMAKLAEEEEDHDSVQDEEDVVVIVPEEGKEDEAKADSQLKTISQGIKPGLGEGGQGLGSETAALTKAALRARGAAGRRMSGPEGLEMGLRALGLPTQPDEPGSPKRKSVGWADLKDQIGEAGGEKGAGEPDSPTRLDLTAAKEDKDEETV